MRSAVSIMPKLQVWRTEAMLKRIQKGLCLMTASGEGVSRLRVGTALKPGRRGSCPHDLEPLPDHIPVSRA